MPPRVILREAPPRAPGKRAELRAPTEGSLSEAPGCLPCTAGPARASTFALTCHPERGAASILRQRAELRAPTEGSLSGAPPGPALRRSPLRGRSKGPQGLPPLPPRVILREAPPRSIGHTQNSVRRPKDLYPERRDACLAPQGPQGLPPLPPRVILREAPPRSTGNAQNSVRRPKDLYPERLQALPCARPGSRGPGLARPDKDPAVARMLLW